MFFRLNYHNVSLAPIHQFYKKEKNQNKKKIIRKKKQTETDLNSRNSTLLSTPPDTYWGQFEEISKYNTHLNIAERLWTAWYAWMQNDVLATGIMSFMMHELVYFGRSLPWIFIDSSGLLKNYKIQSVSSRFFLSPLARQDEFLNLMY